MAKEREEVERTWRKGKRNGKAREVIIVKEMGVEQLKHMKCLLDMHIHIKMLPYERTK